MRVGRAEYHCEFIRNLGPLPNMAASKANIVVTHATSKQGTSVVNSLLDTDKFTVKALTRDASSDSALFCGSLTILC